MPHVPFWSAVLSRMVTWWFVTDRMPARGMPLTVKPCTVT
jgi:hypothetical protein